MWNRHPLRHSEVNFSTFNPTATRSRKKIHPIKASRPPKFTPKRALTPFHLADPAYLVIPRVQNVSSAAEIRMNVEERIPDDAWAELQPIYEVRRFRVEKPASFRELIRPLMGIGEKGQKKRVQKKVG